MKRYYSRICFNSHDWVSPSGDARRLEKQNSHVAREGFGGEEWLRNFSFALHGEHYAFLQPINRSFNRVTGQTIGLLLYTIDAARQRVYVGEIGRCDVLTTAQAGAAFKQYRKAGWLKLMQEQAAEFGGSLSTKLEDARYVFNIRFSLDQFKYYDEPRSARPDDTVQRLKRYSLVEVKERNAPNPRDGRKGTHKTPSAENSNRKGCPGVTVDPVHAKMQGKLFEMLRKRYGRAVIMEQDYVDILIKGPQTTLVEIKTDPDARRAIRKAIGQILDYAYFPSRTQLPDIRIVVISPGAATSDVITYVESLRRKFRLPIQYCQFVLSDDTLPEALASM